jgi:hypothetical protein
VEKTAILAHLAGLLLFACGGGSSGSAAVNPPASGSSEPDLPADHPARALLGAQVYDAHGASKTCAAPQASCPESARNADFLDRCHLKGFQVRHCGCEELCSGNVATEEKFYDAQGKARECKPEQSDCTPKDTSASFQDGCTDAGHKLVVCGCEWLCNGPPRAAAAP